MATAKKKTEAPTTRSVARPQAERRVDVAPTPAPRRELDREAISRRAFEIWEKNGRVPGHDLENWLRAEQELRSGMTT